MKAFHRFLDGDGPSDVDWVVSRVCQEFGCLPAAAGKAIEEDENGVIFRIMALRAYSSAKHQWDERPKDAKGPAVEWVKRVEMEIAKEALGRK